MYYLSFILTIKKKNINQKTFSNIMILEKVSSSLIWIILLHISLTEEITGQIMLLSHQLSTCNAIWHSLDKPKYG